MMRWREGYVTSLDRAWAGAQELTVSVGDTAVRALAYPDLVGAPLIADRVLLNVAALERGLGTGGALELRAVERRLRPLADRAGSWRRHRRIRVIEPADVVEDRVALARPVCRDQALQQLRIRQLTAADLTEAACHEHVEGDRVADRPWPRDDAERIELEWQLRRIGADDVGQIAIDAAVYAL